MVGVFDRADVFVILEFEESSTLEEEGIGMFFSPCYERLLTEFVFL